MKKVITFLGTRPEAIKMAPVCHAFRNSDNGIVHRTCNTGQHREMVSPLLSWFEVQPEFSLDLMTHNQSLAGFTSRALQAIDGLLEKESPDLVLCQGDTTTAMVVGLAAFYRRIPVGHVEAGLRTHNRFAPFPEEVNRRIIDTVAEYCFAPTQRAVDELRRESIPAERIVLTGNTAIDALKWSIEKLDRTGLNAFHVPAVLRANFGSGADRKWVLVTAHRRESFGTGMEEIAEAIRTLAALHPALQWVYPVHPNPNVTGIMHNRLGGFRNVHLMPPLDYPVLCWLLSHCKMALTDSGGLQEECPSLGVPVFVLRETSERPEGIDSGNAVLAGTKAESIVSIVDEFLRNEERQRFMRTPRSVYGDGHAAKRIAEYCVRMLGAGMDQP